MSRRVAKYLVGAFLLLALAVGGTALASATGWTVAGGAAVSVKVAAMPRGVTPTATRQGGRVVISWSAQEIADGVPMDRYVVTAHSVDDPARPDIRRTVAAETAVFSGAELAGGRWYWTVAPRYRTWAGAEGGRSQRLRFTVAVPTPATPRLASPAPVTTTVAPPAAVAPARTTPAPIPTTTAPAEEPSPTESETTSPDSAME